jgi:thiaminase/transcriptional activator TenA
MPAEEGAAPMSVAMGSGKFSDLLWGEIESTYHAILQHPFLTGLVDGSLDRHAFAFFVAQDMHYLREYSRALAVVGAKAPTHADTAMFARHAVGAVEVELRLHAILLPALGLDSADIAAVRVGPTTLSYTSYLLATAYAGSFVEGLAAVLPCYWIYARVGTALAERGSPQPEYQRWIDTYAGEEFWAIVNEVLDLMDRVGPDLSLSELTQARQHLAVAARYEWMFWDAAYRREEWPL